MELNKNDLVEKLDLLSKCVSTDGMLSILTHFCFNERKILATDGIKAGIIDFDVKVNGCVDSKIFHKLCTSLPTNELTIIQEDEKLIIESGKTKSEFSLLSAKDFVIDAKDLPDGIGLPITEDFIKGIKNCVVSVEDSEFFTCLSGINIKNIGEKTFLYSSNRESLCRYELENKLDLENTLLIPKEFCDVLIKWFDYYKEGSIYFDEDSITVNFDGAVLHTKIDVCEKFEDLESHINEFLDDEIEFALIPNDFRNILKRCLLFTEDFALFDVKDDGIFITASNSGSGTVEEKLELDGGLYYESDNYSFELNTKALYDVLPLLETLIIIEIDASSNAMLFGKKDRFLYMLCGANQ
jgi:DNA polymerase III sliding clamp (beta) subunit (PCNA family)